MIVKIGDKKYNLYDKDYYVEKYGEEMYNIFVEAELLNNGTYHLVEVKE